MAAEDGIVAESRSSLEGNASAGAYAAGLAPTPTQTPFQRYRRDAYAVGEDARLAAASVSLKATVTTMQTRPSRVRFLGSDRRCRCRCKQ